MAQIISSDEIKETFPKYNPSQAEQFHVVSTKLADKIFYDLLNKDKYKNVILLNGGSASGKTEFMSTHLTRKRGIILDATQSTELGAKIKINKIHKLGKEAEIFAIIPDSLKRAFIAFLNRDRRFSDEHFYKTHSGSRKTLLWIAHNFPTVKIHVIESSYTSKQTLQFAKITFKSREKLIEYLTGIQMSENDIISEIGFK